jgi:uncharacterized protein (UPF0548 family)
MMLLRRPGPEAVRGFLADQARRPFSYEAVGGTRAGPPRGWVVDRNRVRLGAGAEVFARAVAALRRWAMFDLGWVAATASGAAIEPGAPVAVLVRFGAWWLNAARIVYTIDEPRRFGFAYGTLPDHAERGEERFLVEMDETTGEVSYEILAFSRPRLLARLGYPLARRLQRRFAKDSMAAMAAAVRA